MDRTDQATERVKLRHFDMTAHAVEEMAEDDLSLAGVEHAVLNGSCRANPKG
ncbi:MAG: DUF4258 domain-containing protein [Bryobacterales bacterium]|nr:DUF4258 domain-containing protein [Bryobacterales bacterium]